MAKQAIASNYLPPKDLAEQFLVVAEFVADLRGFEMELQILRYPRWHKSTARRLHVFIDINSLAIHGKQKIHELVGIGI